MIHTLKPSSETSVTRLYKKKWEKMKDVRGQITAKIMVNRPKKERKRSYKSKIVMSCGLFSCKGNGLTMYSMDKKNTWQSGSQ